jgi:hypothetical protein
MNSTQPIILTYNNMDTSFEFDLPEVQSNVSSVVRVMIGGSVCTSCEG